MASIPSLAEEFPDATFTIVGDDTIPDASGSTYRKSFAVDTPCFAVRPFPSKVGSSLKMRRSRSLTQYAKGERGTAAEGGGRL